MNPRPPCTQHTVTVTAADLPLSCPMHDEAIWNAHPRVYLPIPQTHGARCPYCGTLYRFEGEAPKGHH